MANTNSKNSNTGDSNTGHYNTGHYNTGNRNTGNRNTGNRNTGNMNTGNRNTGDRNTGDSNTGYYNTGDRNTGNRNTGNMNTGGWNKCNFETGFFNTKQLKTIRVFNKTCDKNVWDNAEKPSLLYFSLVEWITSSDMTEEEKKKNPSYKISGGYLKKYEYKEAFQKSWNEATEEDRELVKQLPNFDASVFYEISGIRIDDKSCDGKEVEIDGVVYVLKKK